MISMNIWTYIPSLDMSDLAPDKWLTESCVIGAVSHEFGGSVATFDQDQRMLNVEVPLESFDMSVADMERIAKSTIVILLANSGKSIPTEKRVWRWSVTGDYQGRELVPSDDRLFMTE